MRSRGSLAVSQRSAARDAASFVANPSPAVKMFVLGLATAIALDATIVRMLVVPAGMALLGRPTGGCPDGSTGSSRS
jgi:uncharacterized membrane protein YdfJ with MMPL/SSD domain